MESPQILAVVPPNVAQNIELRPIINIQFDEIVGPESMLESSFLLERFQDHTEIEGELDHYTVYGRSSLCFFSSANCFSNLLSDSKDGFLLFLLTKSLSVFKVLSHFNSLTSS